MLAQVSQKMIDEREEEEEGNRNKHIVNSIAISCLLSYLVIVTAQLAMPGEDGNYFHTIYIITGSIMLMIGVWHHYSMKQTLVVQTPPSGA